MVHLVLKDIFNQAYELTDRFGAPQSSSAIRHRYEASFTFSLVTKLCLTIHQWLHILNHAHGRLPNVHSTNPGEVYQAVTESVMRGDLAIYQLPKITETSALRGKHSIGLSIIKGPHPHSATDLTPEPITSPDAAKRLLDELGISEKALLAYLNSESLYNNYQRQNPLADALKLLASGELLVYKISLPASAPTPKAVEYVSTTAADKPVPLAPESSPQTAAPAPEPASTEQPPPQTLEECAVRLEEARERLKTDGYQSKYTDEEVQALAQRGELDDRFVVRLIETKYAGDSGYLGQIKDGEVKYWSTTFNQMENADTDPATLCALIGVNYTPGNSYTLVIVDTQAPGAGQAATIVPTHKNLGNFAKREIKGINPKAVDKVMTPNYNDEYAQHAVAFNKRGLSIDKEKDVKRYADTNFASNEDKTEFKTRMKIHERLGANEHYTGDGTTKNLIEGCPNECGVMETFTYDKNPQTLGMLETSGSAKRVQMRPI